MTLNQLLAGCAALLVVLWVVIRVRRRKRGSQHDDRLDTLAAWPPTGIRILGTREREAFQILRNALPEYHVFAQVPLARFLQVPKRHSYTEWMRRLGQQCADLVVCNGATEVVAVVDIQPPPAAQSDRSRRRHERVARALAAARIRHLVWSEHALPSIIAARALIVPRQAVAVPVSVPLAADPAPSGPSPFDDDSRDSTYDERIEMREPPPSTWFSEFDTTPAPLQADKQT